MSRVGSRGTKNPTMSRSAPGQGDLADDAASGESGVQRGGMVQIDSDISPQFVCTVASRISHEQKELFADMSFGAMLSLPELSRVDRQFSLWVYSRVDPDQPAVQMGDGSFRPMDRAAVRLVTGLGNGTREIKYPHEASCADQQIFQDVCLLLGKDRRTKFITVADLERILHNPIEPMDEDEKARQCVAFALLCGSCIFNPVCRHKNLKDPISPELYLAVRDPSLIPSIDWNKYILDVLVACARKVRADLQAGESSVYLTGFNLVPKVIYFDALCKGNGVIPGNPRLPLYSATQIRSLIVDDIDERKPAGRMKTYGRCKVRPYRAPVHLVAGNPDTITVQPEGPPIGADIGNPICLSSEKGGVPDCKIYALSELPEYQAQVLEFVSADVHDHMSAVHKENLNLKTNVESMLGCLKGMIDERNESNVQTVNTMLSRVLTRLGSLRVQKVDGVLRFVKIADDSVHEPGMVGKGKEHVATDIGPQGNEAGGVVGKGKEHVATDIGPQGNEAGGSEVNRTTMSSKGGTAELKVFQRLKLRLNRNNDAAAHVDVSQGAGTSNTIASEDVVPSPESLDLNKRAKLREELEVHGSIARRLEMNTPARTQHRFLVGAGGEAGEASIRHEQMEFVTAFANSPTPTATVVHASLPRNSLHPDSSNSLVRNLIQTTCTVHQTAGTSIPIAIPLATPISLGQYGTSGALYTDCLSTLVPQIQDLNVHDSGSSALNTSLFLGSTANRVSDEEHHKRGYAQSSMLGWVKPLSAFKRPRIPEFSLGNSVDLMTTEQVSARKDEQYYHLLKSATFNEMHRDWFQHNGPITLVLNGGDVRAQFLNDDGYLSKNAIEAILTLKLYPSSTGKLVLGPNWAEYCKMQFQLAYSNFYWDVPEVKWMFGKKSPGATSVTAMCVIYVKVGWCLYVFDVAQSAFHVIDPLVATRDAIHILPKHQKYMEETLRGFIKCAQVFWGAATVPAYESWTPVYHPAFLNEVTDSGLQCLHHIMTFIPSQRTWNLSSDMAVMLKRKFLRAIMTSSKNEGNLPVRLQMK